MNVFQRAWKIVRIAGSLSKFHISLSVTATTFTGFIVYTSSMSPLLYPLLTGIFLLAAGASALNHFQERKTDAKMGRTSGRPIQRGTVSPGLVLWVSSASVIAGSLILLSAFELPVLLLGLFNVFWYNAVYTPLKRITAFAVVPGSVIGGVPPLIGWVAAGGHPLQIEILVIVLFFVVGQMPHFWLLLLKYGKEYELAGLPSLTAIFSIRQINRISFAWIVATVAASALIPAYGLIAHPVVLYLYLGGTTVLVMLTVSHNLLRQSESRHRLPFIALSIFYLMMMILLAADAALISMM
jgi:heme o synthase